MSRISRNCIVGSIVGGTLAILSGCQSAEHVLVLQPHAPHTQRSMTLTAHDGAFAQRDATCEYLLDFPLPGASDGITAFQLYLSLPDGEGSFAVGDGPNQHALFVQEVGHRKGRSAITSGQVHVSEPFMGRGTRTLEFNLFGDDDITLRGSAHVALNSARIRRFSRSFAVGNDDSESAPAPARDDATGS